MDSGKIAIAAGDVQDEEPVTNGPVNAITVCKSY
jgi:phosphoglycerate dehydrogenase-like enzyme